MELQEKARNVSIALILLPLAALLLVFVVSFNFGKKAPPKIEIEDLIHVTKPAPNETISSPLLIEGKARGTWFFEASFPIKLLDAKGAVLGTAIAQAQGDWMTEEFVPFKAEITFNAPTSTPGTLIFQKDNPSGLPEHDAEFAVPVNVQATPQKTITLFYYNPEKDTDSTGNIECSRKGLVGVLRTVPITKTPIQDAINLLLKGELTAEEKGEGITTEYPLPGLTLVAASLKNGELTLTFDDPENKTGGGSCRVGILWFQIEATAKQFEGVKSVKFMPEELFQP